MQDELHWIGSCGKASLGGLVVGFWLAKPKSPLAVDVELHLLRWEPQVQELPELGLLWVFALHASGLRSRGILK